MGGESEGPMTVYDSGLTAQLGESDTAGERERSVGVLIADARVTPERSERLQREREREISRRGERTGRSDNWITNRRRQEQRRTVDGR